jgi:uncharacterized pyridoxal phosphate-dependent enzyme
MGCYEALGIRRVINAHAMLTRLGGTRMPRPVVEAMVEAAGAFVDMHELQRKVGQRIAELTRNEAAFVCTGGSAGIFLSILACMTRGDLRAIARLPNLDGLQDEVVVHRAQRTPYDPAVLLAGAHLVEVGNTTQTFAWELDAAITTRTAAVFYVAGRPFSQGALPLEEVVALAHARGVPVVVDAASMLPPRENLWRYTQAGADLAIFSGGKALRGPQASGLVVGKRELIEAIRENAAPHQRLGRPMKVGKEEMVGLMTAVEWFLAQDDDALMERYEAIVQGFVDRFSRLPGLRAERVFPSDSPQGVPYAHIAWDAEACGIGVEDMRQHLLAGEPAIEVAPAPPDGISISPDTLEPGEDVVIADRLEAAFGSALPAR